MNKIKFALIGYGNIGQRHAHHILSNPDAELTAVCELPGFEFEPGLPPSVKTFSALDSFLEECGADVVNVCTPNYLHHPHSIAALQHGMHVVCEKPMAISSEQCREMIEVAERSQKTIFVVKQNRYNEPVRQVKELMRTRKLGNIFMVNINCFWNRNEYYYDESNWRGTRDKDGGCLFTQFSHFIDIMYYLFGDIDTCKGMQDNFDHPYLDVEDTGSFVMRSEKGAIINFNFSTCSYEKNMEGAITILAKNGTVKIGGQYLNTIEYQHIRDHVLPDITIQAKANDYGRYQGSMSNHDRVIDNVIKTLRGTETVMTNAREGLKVVEIIERMYESVNK